MTFVEELDKTTSVGRTANGAKSNKSTLDPVLDFFSKGGAMRGREEDAIKLFSKAFAADKDLALKSLFYLRDVRGGQGERTTFRACLKWLSDNDTQALYSVMPFISEYGRWDDLIELVDDQSSEVAHIVRQQLAADEKAMEARGSVSLLAKWLPSENTSSVKTRVRARALAGYLELKPAAYRKKIVTLRKYIKLLEQQMSAKDWDGIDYEKVPSQAMRKHTKAFTRNDTERFASYLGAAVKGEKKMNTATLFAYEVYNAVHSGQKDAADAMWANLPDYTNGTNALVMADVSGSMSGLPMSISVSLALYFAERNKGAFNGYFMTFSDEPKLQKVLGATLSDKMQNIERAEWQMSTNIQAGFDAILEAAKKAKATQDELPAVLYIISDMQFNEATDGNEETNFEVAQAKFEEAGYKLPNVVFWNVNAFGSDAPATKYDKGVTMISGASQSAFQLVVAGKDPLELMNDVLGSDRYAPITAG